MAIGDFKRPIYLKHLYKRFFHKIQHFEISKGWVHVLSIANIYLQENRPKKQKQCEKVDKI